MTADSANPSHLYVTYTDFDMSGVCGSAAARIAIELVRSTDGGMTWSPPQVMRQVCSPFNVPGLFVQASQVAVGNGGVVIVAWEAVAADGVHRRLQARTSLTSGSVFFSAVNVSDVACVGNCGTLKGGFRSGFDSPTLAINPKSGAAYIAWHDGRFAQTLDLTSPTGTYNFASILVSRSNNHGKTWSAPVRANQDTVPTTDKYQPGIAVDKSGRVAVCFYDRSQDPNNLQINRACSISADAGVTWTGMQVATPMFFPTHANDVLVNPAYMGDYDALTSDALAVSRGFLGGYQIVSGIGNPDVFANSVQ